MNEKRFIYSVSDAQAQLPALCRSGRSFVISRQGKPAYVVMPSEHYDVLLETLDLLSNPKGMRTLRMARNGLLTYKKLDLADKNFGLRALNKRKK